VLVTFIIISPSLLFLTCIQDRISHNIFYINAEGQTQQPNYNTEANVSIIVEEAEKLFNKLVKDCIEKVIVIDYPFNKSSSLPLLPPSNEQQQKS